MQNECKEIRRCLFRFMGRLIAITSIVSTILWYVDYRHRLSMDRKLRENKTCIWKGWDPSRPACDISHLDYENMTVTYRTYPDPGQLPQSYPGKRHKGVTITTGEGKRINTQLSYEELFEQLELEYEDLYEYYMD